MKKLGVLLLALVMSISMVACVNEVPTDEVEETTAKQTEAEKTTEDAAEAEPMELTLSSELKTNVALGNNSRTFTYQQANPLELADGTVVTQGDLKPVWQYISGQLGFEIDDVAVQDQKAKEMIDVQATNGFSEATVFGGNSIAEKLMSYGAQGYFINLLDYLDYMPNFSAYLEENPNVKAAITAYDGGIYHVPYVAEIGNYARLQHARATWITALLDSTDALVDETETLNVVYTGYWDRNATNVVDLQNEVGADGLTRAEALDTLLAYIAETYPEYTNPSELYLGDTAQYDMDELVALLRVVELSPNTLSKLETGEVVEDAQITPFFLRKSKYREDILRMALYFGGQRVYGSDSYASSSRFYLDENEELHYSYYEEGFQEGMEKLSEMYAEGLIFGEFADLSNTDDFRKALYGNDETEGQRQFGFMTNDWIASTTASNDDVVTMLPPMTTTEKLDGETEFVHIVENSRVIKPDGWSISAASSEEEINAAITLFDYIFSEEGHKVQNYGIPSNLVEGETFESGGIEYPKFNDWLHEAAAEYKNNDISSFLRDFMGSHIPIGYQKEIGFEKQNTTESGVAGWDLYESMNVPLTTYDAEDSRWRLIPPVFSLTEQDTAKLNTLAISDDQRDQLFLYISNSDSAVGSMEEFNQMLIDAGIEDYINLYQGAYDRSVSK